MFFIRNITIGFILFAIFVTGVFLFLSGQVFSNTLEQYLVNERSQYVTALASVVFAPTATSTQAGTNRVVENLNVYAAQEGVQFLRLVDPATRRIVASSDGTEVGMIYEETLTLSRGETTIDHHTPDAPGSSVVIDIAHLGPNNTALWMGVTSSFLIAPIIVFSAQAALLLIATFATIGFVLYIIQRTYIVKPLRTLHNALSEMYTKDNGNLPDRLPRDVGALLQSFRSVAEKIKSTLERDKTVSEMKSNFITTTAHQLRTPLSGINWALDSLLADQQKLDEEQRMLIEQSLQKTKELVGIVGRLLNAASIEEGKFGYHFEPTSLRDEVAAVVEEEQQLAQKYNITLSFEAVGQEFPNVRIDQERIRWVLRNLVENAVRYSNEGGTVTVWLEQISGALRVSVADNGIGIPESMRDKIFTKFFRAKNAVEKRDDGSGLGLYIAQNIVTHHGGKIWFETQEGKGSTFYFTIPT